MKKMQGTVERINKYSQDVYQVEIAFTTRLPQIQPGQFLHLALDEYDITGGFWPESRVFSICNINSTSLTIIYSVKGVFTKRMEKELSEGKNIWIKLPFGSFSIESNSDESVVLVAGGTGISPYINYLERVSRNNVMCRNVTLFYGIRNETSIIFEELLNKLNQIKPKFKSYIYVENDTSRFIHGKISKEDVLNVIKNSGNSKVYISGPPLMIKVFKDFLTINGISENKIYIDEWE